MSYNVVRKGKPKEKEKNETKEFARFINNSYNNINNININKFIIITNIIIFINNNYFSIAIDILIF